MAAFFVWMKGLRGPTPALFADRKEPDLTALEKSRLLAPEIKLKPEEEDLDLKTLAAIYPPPLTEEEKIKNYNPKWSEYPGIFLEPECRNCYAVERMWCSEPQEPCEECGKEWVKFTLG